MAHNFAAAEPQTSPYGVLRSLILFEARTPLYGGKKYGVWSMTPYGVNLGGIFIGY